MPSFVVYCCSHQPAAVSIPDARVAVETQRAKHEAARRRLQALEDDNRVLRQSEAEAQVRCDFCFNLFKGATLVWCRISVPHFVCVFWMCLPPPDHFERRAREKE